IKVAQSGIALWCVPPDAHCDRSNGNEVQTGTRAGKAVRQARPLRRTLELVGWAWGAPRGMWSAYGSRRQFERYATSVDTGRRGVTRGTSPARRAVGGDREVYLRRWSVCEEV